MRDKNTERKFLRRVYLAQVKCIRIYGDEESTYSFKGNDGITHEESDDKVGPWRAL